MLGVGLTLVVDIWRWGTLLYHSLSDSCNNTRVLSHVPQMSRCVMLACIFIGSWIPCTNSVVTVQCPPNCVLVLRVRVFACHSDINRISHVLGGISCLSLSLSFSHFFFHLMYIACIVLILVLLPWFAFTFVFFLPTSAGYFWQKKENLQYFVRSTYKQLVKHLIFSYTLSWSHGNLTWQFVKCWTDFLAEFAPLGGG